VTTSCLWLAYCPTRYLIHTGGGLEQIYTDITYTALPQYITADMPSRHLEEGETDYIPMEGGGVVEGEALGLCMPMGLLPWPHSTTCHVLPLRDLGAMERRPQHLAATFKQHTAQP